MAIAALDLGERRIGIAISDEASESAYPLCTISRHSVERDVDAIRQAFAGRKIDRIVVGLPLQMDASEGQMARHVRRFADKLGQALRLEVIFQDERLSSFEAEQRLAGVLRKKGKKAAIDAVAAAVILESWLALSR